MSSFDSSYFEHYYRKVFIQDIDNQECINQNSVVEAEISPPATPRDAAAISGKANGSGQLLSSGSQEIYLDISAEIEENRKISKEKAESYYG